jgi:hypothetical protein
MNRLHYFRAGDPSSTLATLPNSLRAASGRSRPASPKISFAWNNRAELSSKLCEWV